MHIFVFIIIDNLSLNFIKFNLNLYEKILTLVDI